MCVFSPRRPGTTAVMAAALTALLLCATPAAGASASATQSPSAPRSVVPTPTPTRSYAPGTITTLAGNGAPFYSGDGDPATSAGLSPYGLVVDGGGNVFIADSENHRIRRVAASTGIITTVAGNGVGFYAGSFSGDGGPATSAGLANPLELAMDGSGNLFINDRENGRIRRVAAVTGVITTVAGGGDILGPGGDGGPATSAQIYSYRGMAVDSGGNVFITDYHNHRIRRVAADSGIIMTVAGNGSWGFSGDGGPGTSASLAIPQGVAVDSGGNVLFSDYGNNRIRRLATGTGIITTVAGNGTYGFSGDGGPATSASIGYVVALAVDGGGNLLISDDRRIRRVAADTGIITTVAGNGGSDCMGDGGLATSVGLCFPQGVAVDHIGNLLIADSGSNRVRLVAAPTQPSPLPTPSPSTTPYCLPSLFRPLPRTDLVGALLGSALSPGLPVLAPTEAGCRQACCDAAACDGYSFDASSARQLSAASECFLFVNVTQLVPNNLMVSGLRESVLL